MSNIASDIVNLNSQLIEAADAYYKNAAPILTDAAFDAFEKQLKSLVASNPQYASLATYLKKVGSDLSTTSTGRVAHRIPMLSIENMYTEEDFLGQFDRFGGVPVVIEPKFDGISVSLTYVDGKLTKALTRGDGESGEDMTAQVRCTEIPQSLGKALLIDDVEIAIPSLLEIRGELVMNETTLIALNAKYKAAGQKTYANTRNLTAGTMKLSADKYAATIRERKITIRPWDVIADGIPDSRIKRLWMIHAAGFPAPEGGIVTSRDHVISVLRKMLDLNKAADIYRDGVVMKVDSVKTSRSLGLASKYTNYQTCFKPQGDKAVTYVREVMWQIGRTGKLTPVAICDPVNLAGAVITRVTINNVTWLTDMGLTIGAKISMLRSGGVIPKVESVIDPTGTPITPPKYCPECSGELDVFTDSTADAVTHIYCYNSKCSGRVIGHFCFVGDREVLEVDGLGPDMATKLVKGSYAFNVADLMEFANDTNSALNRLGEAAVTTYFQKRGFSVAIVKMVRSLETAKKASWERWIAALGIPMVSDTLGKVIAKEMKLTSGDMVNLVAKFKEFTKMSIAGVGPSKKDALNDWLRAPFNCDIIARLAVAGVTPTPVAQNAVIAGAPLAGVAFCITGEFAESREVIIKKLESLGAGSKSSVTKNCNLLIVGSVPGKSKTVAATKLGTKTVGAEWLQEVFTKNGLKFGGSFDVDEA